MVHILPRMEYRMDSAKSPEEITDILKSVTASGKIGFGNPANAEFIGEVYASDFKIASKITYRNSFLPVIEGTISVESGKSVIDIKMRLHLFVQIFLTIWFGMAGFVFLITLLNVLVEGMKEVEGLLFAALFLILGQVVVRSAFYIPAKKAIRRLEELLG